MSIYKKLKKSEGFTLIELLVVIAIIGVLSTLILLQLNVARAKARDAKRIADINQLRTAVELHFDDRGGSYPGAQLCAPTSAGCQIATGPLNYDRGNIADYLSAQVVPRDPLNKANYKYAWGSGVQAVAANVRVSQYHIWMDLERMNTPAFTGDTDIDSSVWTGGVGPGGDRTNASATANESCNATPPSGFDCLYDLGQK